MKVQIVSPPMFPQSYLTNYRAVEFAFAKQNTTYSIFEEAKYYLNYYNIAI